MVASSFFTENSSFFEKLLDFSKVRWYYVQYALYYLIFEQRTIQACIIKGGYHFEAPYKKAGLAYHPCSFSVHPFFVYPFYCLS